MRLNEYSKRELKQMYDRGIIDKCPICRKYHEADKPKWPLSNIWICESCKKEREKENGK